MENTYTLKWGGYYFILSVFITLVAIGIIGAGIAIGGLRPLEYYSYTPGWLRLAFYPRAGLGLIVLGILVWWGGTSIALFHTLVEAIGARIADRFDVEVLKSDVLSVLDDRLADIHQETTQTRRLVNRASREDAASEFEFQEELHED